LHWSSRLRGGRVANRPTVVTLPRLLILLEAIHRFLDLRAQIRTMERLLMHLLPTALTIPPQAIQASLRPLLLQHNPHRILEPHRVMRCVWRQQEHVAFVDVDVAELLGSWERCVDNLEQHGAFMLVEPFSGLVDVVVCALVGTADDHDGDAVVVDAVVVNGRFEHVGVFGNPGYMMLETDFGNSGICAPFGYVQWCAYHFVLWCL
jgi:hypothetical protein